MKISITGESGFYKTSGLDVILIAGVLIFSVISIFRFSLSRPKQSAEAKEVLIYQNQKLLEKTGLNKDRMIALLSGQMQIEIRGGKLSVIHSECPQHICVNMGWIQYSGQTIVCVPNRVVIEIKSSSSPLLDVVAY